jgi:branched-chain amino acid transport system substrate-binding protein
VISVSSVTEAAVGKPLSDAKVPVVGGSGYNPAVWSALPYWNGVATTVEAIGAAQPISATVFGKTKLGQVGCAEAPECKTSGARFAAAVPAGATFTKSFLIAADAPNYTAECLAFIESKTDFIQLGVPAPTATRFYDECNTQGYTGVYGASAGTVIKNFYTLKGIKLAGPLNGFPWFVDAPPVVRYRKIMQDAGVGDDVWAQPTATVTYAGLELFKKALTASGATLSEPVTRDNVISAYTQIKGETLDGLLAQPTTYSATGIAPKVPCYWAYSYADGKFTGDFTPKCIAPAAK